MVRQGLNLINYYTHQKRFLPFVDIPGTMFVVIVITQ